MTKELRLSVEETITSCLKNKLKKYSPESKEMPFHYRLIGKDRMALFSFIHSLNTSFGTSIFEPVAISLSKGRFAFAKCQHTVGTHIYSDTQSVITDITNELRSSNDNSFPNKIKELKRLQSSLIGEKEIGRAHV